MKKHKKIILCICFALLFSNKFTIFAAEQQIDNGEILKSLYTKELSSLIETNIDDALQTELLSLAQNIENEMLYDNETLQLDNTNLPPQTLQYVPTYAGTYIDNNKLIVCITKEHVITSLDNEKITYRVVENAYNELASKKANISSKYEILYNQYAHTMGLESQLLNSFCGVGIDEEQNSLIVDIANLTDEKINTFNTLFGSDEDIIFHDVGSTTKDTATYYPGRAIYVITSVDGINTSIKRVSIGYRAYWKAASGNKYGFTTCGHAIKDSVNNKVYSDSSCQNIIGTVRKWQYKDSVDAAFIELTSGNSIGMTTYYSDSDGNTSGGDAIKPNSIIKSLTKGAKVYKVGATTKKTSATVTNINYDFTVNGVTFTNLTKTGEFCSGGDSGGLVYHYANGAYWPAGLIKGGGGIGIFAYSVFTKAYEVLNEMDVYPY